MEQIISVATKKTLFQRMPKPLKIILIILSIITIIYWVIFAIYNLLKLNRIVMAYIFDKSHYWTFVICLLMIGIAFIIYGQIEYNIFGKLYNCINEYLQYLIQYL